MASAHGSKFGSSSSEEPLGVGPGGTNGDYCPAKTVNSASIEG